MAKDRKPEDWGPKERFQAVLDAQDLDEQKLGQFLRTKGLHSSQITEWRKEALTIAIQSGGKRGRPRKDPELVAAEVQITALKRDLRRKEKALAEATAIMILQKKARALWGADEDDE